MMCCFSNKRFGSLTGAFQTRHEAVQGIKQGIELARYRVIHQSQIMWTASSYGLDNPLQGAQGCVDREPTK